MLLEKAIQQALATVSADLTIHSWTPDLAVVERKPRSIEVIRNSQSDFVLKFWMRGVEYGRGNVAEFTDVVASIVVFLIEQAALRTMASRFTWFEPNAKGVAHERGPQEFVSQMWSDLERWVTSKDFHLPAHLSLGPIVREAAKRPELRQLRPFTSLSSLCFSRTTEYPFSEDCAHAQPIGNDLYRVTSADGTVLFDRVDAVQAADALVASLPPNCGPAIQGTAEDL